MTAALRKRSGRFLFRTIYAARHDKTLFVSGAPTLRYKAIIGAIDAGKGAGVDRIGIITQGLKRQ